VLVHPLRKPPAKDVGTPPPFAAAYADVLAECHREALRDAAITYLDECFSTIAYGRMRMIVFPVTRSLNDLEES